MKLASCLATVVLGLVSLAHLLRIAFGVQVTIGSTVLPVWLSLIGAIVTGGLALALWRERRT